MLGRNTIVTMNVRSLIVDLVVHNEPFTADFFNQPELCSISLFIHPAVIILVIFTITAVFSNRIPVISYLKGTRSFEARREHSYAEVDHANIKLAKYEEEKVQ
jgi:hypothetical protein